MMLGEWVTIAVLIALALTGFVAANLKVSAPNEVLFFSGRQRRRPDGRMVGYRVVRGGRGFRTPVFESVHRMSLETIPVQLDLHGVLSQGLIPLNVQAMANVKVATDDEGLYNAAERFLGLGTQEIARVAAQTLEGSLRGVLAKVTPEGANSERNACAHEVRQETEADFERLGLVIDTFRIQQIGDGQRYLEAIGRQRNAEVQRDARIAEAEADAEARRVAAEQERNATIAELTSQQAVVDSDNELRVKRAEADASGREAEAYAEVAGELAHVQRGRALQEERIAYNRAQYEAEVVTPAQAEKTAAELRAQGEAARVLEQGKATAEAVSLMRQEWEDGATRDLFLLQQLPDLTEHITRVVSENLAIDKLTVLDGGHGDGVANLTGGLVGSVARVMEEIENATGLGIREMLQHPRTNNEVPREYAE